MLGRHCNLKHNPQGPTSDLHRRWTYTCTPLTVCNLAAAPPCSNPLLQPLNDTNSQNPPTTTISTYIDQCPVPRPRSLSAGKRWPPRNPRHRYTPFLTHAERAERIEARETRNPELIKRVLLRAKYFATPAGAAVLDFFTEQRKLEEKHRQQRLAITAPLLRNGTATSIKFKVSSSGDIELDYAATSDAEQGEAGDTNGNVEGNAASNDATGSIEILD
eukprot:gene6302-27646_t